MGNKTLVIIFARCFRQIAKLSAGMSDQFFVDLLNQESEKLLNKYIFFLRYQGTITNQVIQKDILQHQDVAKYCDITQHDFHVAQYHQDLIYQIKNILKLLDILNHLRLIKSNTPLLLERDLLLLELSILNSCQEKQFNSKKGEPNLKPKKNQITSQLLSDSLGQVHKQVALFVASRERVRNTEVFSKFSNISRRTLKRKLSELVEVNVIKRIATGKKVFYIIVSKSNFETI